MKLLGFAEGAVERSFTKTPVPANCVLKIRDIVSFARSHEKSGVAFVIWSIIGDRSKQETSRCAKIAHAACVLT